MVPSVHPPGNHHVKSSRCLFLRPANTSASSRADINNLGASVGALVQSPSDADAQAIPSGDLETVKLYAARVARIGQQLHA